MIIQMRDAHDHTVTVNQERQAEFEARGFTLVGEKKLEEGQLVGHAVRIHAEDNEAPPNHQPRMIQITDGHQTIWADVAHTAKFSVYVQRGFLPIPPGLPVERKDDESDEEWDERRIQHGAEYDRHVAEIKAQARAKSAS